MHVITASTTAALDFNGGVMGLDYPAEHASLDRQLGSGRFPRPITAERRMPTSLCSCEDGIDNFKVKPPPPPSPETTLETTYNPRDKKILDRLQYMEFQSRLSQARTPEALFAFIAREGKSGRHIELSKYHAAVLRHLVVLRGGLDDLTRFLDEPVVNPPGADNLHRIMRFRAALVQSIEEYDDFLKLISMPSLRGRWTNPDLEASLRLVCTVPAKLFANEAHHRSAIRSGLLRIWELFKTDPGLFSGGLNSGCIQKMITTVSAIGSPTDIEIFTTDVIQHGSKPQRGDLKKAIATAFQRYLTMKRPPTSSNAQLAAEDQPIRWMIQALTQVDPPVARALVTHTTTALRRAAESQKLASIPRHTLYPWIATVAHCRRLKPQTCSPREWSEIEGALVRPWRFELITPYLLSRSKSAAGALLFEHWAQGQSKQLGDHGDAPRDDYTSAMRLFREYQCRRPGHQSLYNIIDALRRSHLPYMDVLQDLLTFLRRNHRPFDMYQLCRCLICSRTPIDAHLLQEALSDVAKANGYLGVRLLTQQLRYNRASISLDQCRDLFRILIHESSVHPAHIINFFLGPAEARFVKRKSGALHGKAGFIRRISHPKRRIRPLVRLLHGLAYDFAHAAHLSSRVAFRYVHLCHLLVRFYRRPVRPILTRAMTHAAITRPLLEGGWVSTTKFSFVLRCVTLAEGPQVACKLNEIVRLWARVNNQKRAGHDIRSSALFRRHIGR